jgi:tetratricopeptide (TPR) repeat protein
MRRLKLIIALVVIFLFTEGNLNATEYVAYSLKVAQERIASTPKGKDFWELQPEVFYLGGITAVRGLVYDRKTGDAIIVGERDPNRAILTLDDFVVALRARFIYGKWPLVSIDPTEETKKTDMQIVRFEGGIEDTQFGEDLFDADYRLKKIGMGLLPSGFPGLKTYWDLSMEKSKEITRSHRISSRFWFYPVLPSVTVREDVVSIKGLKVGVFTEVLSAEIDGNRIEDFSTFQDTAGDTFAQMVSDNFDKLAKPHPPFLRLQGLDELVALTRAIEEMEERPVLSFWLKDYRVKQVKTEKEVKVLERKEEYQLPAAGGVSRGYRELSGGVELMAIALRLNAGDVTTLKEAVLKTRPSADTLLWSFLVGEWLIPTSPGMLKVENIATLFAHAVFLQKKERYDDVITLYGKIIELNSEFEWAYYNRGLAYFEGKRLYDQAMYDYNRALEINPKNPKNYEAYTNRGNVYAKKKLYDQAIADYNKALQINSRYSEAFNGRGCIYYQKGLYDQAISDFNKAIKIDPMHVVSYANRGCAYQKKGLYDNALSDYNHALAINPRCAVAYFNRGNMYDTMQQYDKAISDYTNATEINLKFAEAYFNRGLAFQRKGLYGQAISDYNRCIEIDPKDASAYHSRGETFTGKGEYEKAISDFNLVIEINPGYSEAYCNRGMLYLKESQYDRAIFDFNRAIAINPKLAEAYFNRGLAFQRKGLYGQAISDYNRCIEVDPKDARAYNFRGLVYQEQDRYEQAILDYSHAIKINPRIYVPYINRGLLYMEILGDKKRACFDLKTACELGACENYEAAKEEGVCK